MRHGECGRGFCIVLSEMTQGASALPKFPESDLAMSNAQPESRDALLAFLSPLLGDALFIAKAREVAKRVLAQEVGAWNDNAGAPSGTTDLLLFAALMLVERVKKMEARVGSGADGRDGQAGRGSPNAGSTPAASTDMAEVESGEG